MDFGRSLERLFRIVGQLSGPLVAGVFAILFFFSWASMAYFESGKPIASLEIFWWFFVVTIATVGYGDFSPSTLGGRITGTVIIVIGIGVFAVAAAKLADRLFQFMHRRRRGMLQLNLEKHLVILGYRHGETEALVREFRSDGLGKDASIVLCADISENPLPKEMDFVSGNINNIETLERACLAHASQIIVYAENDAETFSASVEAEHAAPNAHVVAYFKDSSFVEKLKRLFPGVECVSSLALPMLVQCVQEPGSMATITDIVSNAGNVNLYRHDLPPGFGKRPFGQFFVDMKLIKGITVIALARSCDTNAPVETNPLSETIVSEGMSFFYLSKERIESLSF